MEDIACDNPATAPSQPPGDEYSAQVEGTGTAYGDGCEMGEGDAPLSEFQCVAAGDFVVPPSAEPRVVHASIKDQLGDVVEKLNAYRARNHAAFQAYAEEFNKQASAILENACQAFNESEYYFEKHYGAKVAGITGALERIEALMDEIRTLGEKGSEYYAALFSMQHIGASQATAH